MLGWNLPLTGRCCSLAVSGRHNVAAPGGAGVLRMCGGGRFEGLDPGVTVSRDTVARETAEGVNLAKNLGVAFYRFEVDLFNIKD